MKPWQVLRSRYLVDDPPWLRLRADTCRTPAGQIIQNFYVYELNPWVCVVALTADENVVLVRQYRHGLRQITLEFPGGGVDPGEPPLEAARRELLEETGYGGGEWVETGRTSADPATHANQMTCFLARGVEKRVSPHVDSTEEIEVVVQPLAGLVRLAGQSQLMQAMHVSALFYALVSLNDLNFR